MVARIHIFQQQGVIRNEHIIGHVAYANPANGAGFHRIVRKELENLNFLIAGLAHAGQLIEAEHIILRQLPVCGDVGVHGHDGIILHIADGEQGVILIQVFRRQRHLGIQVGEPIRHARCAHPRRFLRTQIGVRSTIVDLVLRRITHEGACFLCHLNQPGRSNHVFRIIQVNQADH